MNIPPDVLWYEICSYLSPQEHSRLCEVCKKLDRWVINQLFISDKCRFQRIGAILPMQIQWPKREGNDFSSYAFYVQKLVEQVALVVGKHCLSQKFTDAKIDRLFQENPLLDSIRDAVECCKDSRLNTLCVQSRFFLDNLVCSEDQKQLVRCFMTLARSGYIEMAVKLFDSISSDVQKSLLRHLDTDLHTLLPGKFPILGARTICKMAEDILQNESGLEQYRPLYALVLLQAYVSCLTLKDWTNAEKFAALLTEQELAHTSDRDGESYLETEDVARATWAWTNPNAPLEVQRASYQKLKAWCQRPDFDLNRVLTELTEYRDAKHVFEGAHSWISNEGSPYAFFSHNEYVSDAILLAKIDAFNGWMIWNSGANIEAVLNRESDLNQSIFGGYFASDYLRRGKIQSAMHWVGKLDFSGSHPYVLQHHLSNIIRACTARISSWKAFLNAYPVDWPSRDWLCALCAYQLQLENNEAEAFECIQLMKNSEEKRRAEANHHHWNLNQEPLDESDTESSADSSEHFDPEFMLTDQELTEYRIEHAWWLAGN